MLTSASEAGGVELEVRLRAVNERWACPPARLMPPEARMRG
jgi:hypothetical protein